MIRLLVVAILSLSTLGASAALAQSQTLLEERQRLPAGSGWLEVRTGVSFGDSATIDQTLAITGKDDPAAVFGIGLHYRTARLDFGAIFEHAGSFRFAGLETLRRVGGQFRAAASLRWRYIEEAWGALFLRLSPGLMVFSHSDELRFQVANLTANADFRDVDTHNVGFSLGFDFGAVIYITDMVGVSLHLDIVAGTSSIGGLGQDFDYSVVRGLFTAGLEWRM